MNELQKFEQRQMDALDTNRKDMPDFKPGDTVKVNVRITEKTAKEVKTRIQAYEGVCIARSGQGLNANFTVRKISYGEGVERVFPVYAPVIESVQLIRRGSVRRAKLYYLRERSGKSARIKEKTDYKSKAKAKEEASKADKKEASVA